MTDSAEGKSGQCQRPSTAAPTAEELPSRPATSLEPDAASNNPDASNNNAEWKSRCTDTIPINGPPDEPAQEHRKQDAPSSPPRAADRCPWNWRYLETRCCLKAGLDASRVYGDTQREEMLRLMAHQYALEAMACKASGEWDRECQESPTVQDSIKWRTSDGGCPLYQRWLDVTWRIQKEIVPLYVEIEGIDHLAPQPEEKDTLKDVVSRKCLVKRGSTARASAGAQISERWSSQLMDLWLSFGPLRKDGGLAYFASADLPLLHAGTKKRSLAHAVTLAGFFQPPKMPRRVAGIDSAPQPSTAAAPAAPNTPCLPTPAVLTTAPASLGQAGSETSAGPESLRRSDIAASKSTGTDRTTSGFDRLSKDLTICACSLLAVAINAQASM